MEALFLYLDSVKLKYLFFAETETKTTKTISPVATLSTAVYICIGRSRWNNMVLGKCGDRKIVASFYYNCQRELYVFF